MFWILNCVGIAEIMIPESLLGGNGAHGLLSGNGISPTFTCLLAIKGAIQEMSVFLLELPALDIHILMN